MNEEFAKDTSPSQSNTGGVENITPTKEWGYDLYPERKGRYKSSFKEKLLLGGTEKLDRLKCETKVYDCIKSSEFYLFM